MNTNWRDDTPLSPAFILRLLMEQVNILICQLLAVQNYCKDIHYNAKGEAFYSKHLLADRISENIYDYIDQIKEVTFLGNDEEPLQSGEYLLKATSYIPEIAKEDKKNFESLGKLILDTLSTIENLDDTTKGEENLYGAIAQDLQTSLGLINRQIED